MPAINARGHKPTCSLLIQQMGVIVRMGVILPSILCVSLVCADADDLSLQTKKWHTSPVSYIQSSTIYPVVDWTIVQKFKPGMTSDAARLLVFELQWYHHPINAIVYSRNESHEYEVALKLSDDKKTITDVSYKVRR